LDEFNDIIRDGFKSILIGKYSFYLDVAGELLKRRKRRGNAKILGLGCFKDVGFNGHTKKLTWN